MASVVVVGAGVVGAATGHGLSHHGHEVTLVDTNPARVQTLRQQGFNATSVLTLGTGDSFVFVAIPTPADEGTGYDLSTLVTCLEAVGKALSLTTARPTLVVRSTVPPRTTDEVVVPVLERCSGKVAGRDFGVAYAPEFLREASAAQDFLAPWITVLASRYPESLDRLTELFLPFGGELRAFDNPVVAELIKIAHNAFNATKISFWNDMWRLCQELEVDAEAVSTTVARSAEGSFNPAYGIRGGSPYEGGCLPKDLEGLLAFGRSVDVDLPVIRGVRIANQMVAEAT